MGSIPLRHLSINYSPPPTDTQADALGTKNNKKWLRSLLGMLQCEVLSVEKASMASGLEAKDAEMERMQQEHSNVQTQLLLCQERVSHLQTELLQVCPHCFFFICFHTAFFHFSFFSILFSFFWEWKWGQKGPFLSM